MRGDLAFIYSGRFGRYCYGDDHPFKVLRYRLAYELIEELGLLDGAGVELVEAQPVEESLLLTFHRPDYLARLREFNDSAESRADFVYGLGDVENPVFPGVYDWARLVCGGTVEAARRVADGRCRAAFNMAGGWHHAHAARASGFSFLNDAVVAIHELTARGLRVAYVDIDAHHGDGVQEAFYASDQVLTISLHETGDDFFPHSGYVREAGSGAGRGWSVNVPFFRHADDRLFRRAVDEVVLPVIGRFAPDILVTQMGVDALRTDPLARLEMTTAAIDYAARAFATLDLPWVALGGGGYDKVNVARGWSLVWGVMRGMEVPDLLPPRFRQRLVELGVRGERLRDLPHQAQPDDYRRAARIFEENLDQLTATVFPWQQIKEGGGYGAL